MVYVFRFAQGGNIVCTAGCVKVWCFHVNLPWSASHSASWGAWTTTSRLGWVRFPMMCVISKRLVHHVHHSTSHQCHVTTSNLLLLRSSWGRSGGRNQDPAIMAPFCSGVVSLFSWTVWLEKSHLAWHGVPPSANSDLWVSLRPVNFLSGEWLCDAFARGSFFQEKHRSLRSWGSSSMLSWRFPTMRGTLPPNHPTLINRVPLVP